MESLCDRRHFRCPGTKTRMMKFVKQTVAMSVLLILTVPGFRNGLHHEKNAYRTQMFPLVLLSHCLPFWMPWRPVKLLLSVDTKCPHCRMQLNAYFVLQCIVCNVVIGWRSELKYSRLRGTDRETHKKKPCWFHIGFTFILVQAVTHLTGIGFFFPPLDRKAPSRRSTEFLLDLMKVIF